MGVTLPTLRNAARRVGVLSTVDVPRPRTRTTRREMTRRVVACAVVGLTGFVLLVPNLGPLLSPGTPLVGVVLSVVSSVVSVGLVVVAVALYRSGFTTRNAVRIAAWNLLGVVTLGAVMVALVGYQREVGALVAPSSFAVSSLLSVGAVAHVIIGVYDARRVRAEQLARERRRISVLNRVLRHNLRNDANVLIGHAGQLEASVESPELARSARVVRERAETIGSLAEGAKQLARGHEHDPRSNRPLALRTVVDDALTDAAVKVDDLSVADVSVVADPALCQIALTHLVENAVEHGGRPVRVATRVGDDYVDVDVDDAGPGVPDNERAVVTGDAEITQLEHSSGLGLWVASTAANACGGSVLFGEDEDATVTLRLPLAA